MTRSSFNLQVTWLLAATDRSFPVMMDPYNSLEANIHKDLVRSGGAVMLAYQLLTLEPL